MSKAINGFLLMLCLSSCGFLKDKSMAGETLTNPVVEYGADPWVVRDGDTFHYCYSKERALYVKSVNRLSELNTAEAHMIWKAPDSGTYSREIWAPELHRINNKWYVYFAADDGDNVNHRMHVLLSESDVPHNGFTYSGPISDASNKWAIDGTVLNHKDKMYFMWSGWEGDVNEAQHLYIAEMESPTSVSSERVKLSSPEFEWEKRGSGNGLPTINEGPQVLQRGDRLFVIYSASGSWSDHYCLGMLELTGDNPMLASAWRKNPDPVFTGTEEVISPGHASYIEISGQHYIVYHATKFKGGGWDQREVRIQPFSWQNGQPFFGEPLGNDVKIEISY